MAREYERLIDLLSGVEQRFDEKLKVFNLNLHKILIKKENVATELHALRREIRDVRYTLDEVKLGMEALKTDINRVEVNASTTNTRTSISSTKLRAKENSQKIKDFLKNSETIYNAQILNCFINGVVSVLQMKTGVKPSFKKPHIIIKNYVPQYISGRMSLTRTTGNGYISLSFPKETISEITRQILRNVENIDEKIEKLSKDMAKELCNQICGNAKLGMEQEGFQFQLEIPEIIDFVDWKNSEYKHPKIILEFAYCKKYSFQLEFWD